ncbi:MAG: fasciclin domain-containing protein [Cyclobacteriaceae bacterium]
MKNLTLVALLGILLITTTSCGEEEIAPQENLDDIVTLAQSNGFNSLAAALTRADLIGALQGDGPFTVFAPSDEAFSALLTEIGQTSVDNVPANVLAEILKYHVIEGVVRSTDVSDGAVATLEGTRITLSTASGITVNGNSVVDGYDLEASNGIIHTIDGVLVPESAGMFVNTVLEPAYFNKDFTTLVSAVVKADLTSTLLSAENLTIFAPSNDAFTAAGVDVNSLSAQDLAGVLAYHVLTSKVLSTGIPAKATTFGGGAINFSLTSSGNFINGNTEIVAVDIESGSGVVHVLNDVLLPPSGNVVDIAVANDDFSSLVAALTRTATEGETNLVDVLNGDGPFTVFAPTNAAFQSLLDSNDDWSTLNDIPISTLVTVLTYHVVGARAYDVDLSTAIDNNNEIMTVEGAKLSVDLTNLTINTDVNITGTNVNATNGVIHVIDKVLLP